MKNLPLLFSVSFATVAYARQPPSVCMLLSPAVTLTAGQSVSAIVENDQARPCLATLAFSNDDFLPITFDLQPTTCLGYQLAEISIPVNSPNGNVSVLWECAGDNTSTCMKASIQGGSENADALMSPQSGTMQCLVPFASSSTFSTVSTQISGSMAGGATTTSNTPVSASSTMPGGTSSSTAGGTSTSTAGGTSSSTSGKTPGSTPTSTSTSPQVLSTTSLAIIPVDFQVTTTSGATVASTECPCSQSGSNGSPFK